MAQTDVDTIRGGYDAFGRQDIPAVLAVFDDSIEWNVPKLLPSGGSFRGPDAVAGFFGSLSGDFSELNVNPEEFIAGDGHVVVLGRHTGKLATNGNAFEMPFAHVWTMRDGKAVRFREYWDPVNMLEALGR